MTGHRIVLTASALHPRNRSTPYAFKSVSHCIFDKTLLNFKILTALRSRLFMAGFAVTNGSRCASTEG
jgi:hypothetical protein